MRAIDKIVCRVTGSLYDLAGRRAFPRVVRIETTNRCNARCTICPRAKMTRPVGVMDETLYRSIVDECARSGCRTLHLHNFGEPLLDPALPERIAYAKSAGIERVKIFSNGSLLTGDLASRLIASGLDEIKVSIDGADRAEFQSIRVGLDYDRVVANLREFVALRKSRGLAKPKLTATCVSTSDKGETRASLENVVDSFEFVRIHNWGEGDSLRRGVRKPCWRVWGTFTVLWTGEVVACCLDYDGAQVVGRLPEGGSIREIWAGERCKEIRRLHRAGAQEKINICEHCSKSFF